MRLYQVANKHKICPKLFLVWLRGRGFVPSQTRSVTSTLNAAVLAEIKKARTALVLLRKETQSRLAKARREHSKEKEPLPASLLKAFVTKLKLGEKLGASARSHYAITPDEMVILRLASNGRSIFRGKSKKVPFATTARGQWTGNRYIAVNPWLGPPKERKSKFSGQPDVFQTIW